MTAFERWANHVSNLLVGSTGVVYAVMRYLLDPADPYAIVNHPLQPLVQHLHILTAPLLVFTTALVWQRHVAPRLRRRGHPRRISGVELALSLGPMTLSGYLLQVSADDRWRQIWAVVHLCTSALWIAGYLVHQLTDAGGPGTRSPAGRPRSGLPGAQAGRRVEQRLP